MLAAYMLHCYGDAKFSDFESFQIEVMNKMTLANILIVNVDALK